MPTGERTVVQGQATRLRVFAFCKDFMERHERSPSAGEIARALNLTRSIAHKHMAALDGADGLPLPMNKQHGHLPPPLHDARVPDVVELLERSGAV